MTLHHRHPRQQGFSMLEVLIAVLVFSLGMLGLAGLLIFAISSNHVAYLRTQATFLAHNMADRMGANPIALWNGDYNIAAIKPAGAGITVDCVAGCTPADLATHDIEAWSQQLHTFLPGAAATIACNTSGLTYAPNAAQILNRPPYGGTCAMTITWNEARASDRSVNAHTFAWTFQP